MSELTFKKVISNNEFNNYLNNVNKILKRWKKEKKKTLSTVLHTDIESIYSFIFKMIRKYTGIISSIKVILKMKRRF